MSRARRNAAIFALLALGAGCGGKTGSQGAGGSTGVGGSNAGSSGVGGSSSGGTAGTGGGGGGKTIDQLIVTVCAQAAKLSCGPSDCESELYESWNKAHSAGCEELLRDALECLDQTPLACNGDELTVPVACAPIVDKLESCVGTTGECSGGGGGGSCSIECSGPPAWGVECAEQGGSLSCTCTDGPNVGASFSLPGSCSDFAALNNAEAWCT